MASSNGHHGYDEDLLASAPAPTKGMVQSGYATDLLVDKPKQSRRTDLESNRHKSLSSRHGSVPKSAAEYQPVDTKFTTPKRIPFYRTRRGIIILIIIAIILLAAIIGGAVGGALANKKDSDPLKQQAVNSSSSSTTAGDVTGDIGSPQGATDPQSKPRTTTVTIFSSPPGASPAPPASESPLPLSFSLGIRP